MATTTAQRSTTYSIAEAAHLLGVSADTVRRRIKDQTIPAIRIGGGHRVPVVVVDTILHPYTSSPVVYTTDGNIICPFCSHTHRHGEGDGPRNPHCVASASVDTYGVGYIVKYV